MTTGKEIERAPENEGSHRLPSRVPPHAPAFTRATTGLYSHHAVQSNRRQHYLAPPQAVGVAGHVRAGGV